VCVHRIGHCQVQIFHILGVEYHEHNELLFLLLYCINTCKVYRQIYLLTAIGLTPGGSSTVHIYTQTIHRTTEFINSEECGPCPVFASYTLAFALQVKKEHGKTSVRVAEECQLAR